MYINLVYILTFSTSYIGHKSLEHFLPFMEYLSMIKLIITFLHKLLYKHSWLKFSVNPKIKLLVGLIQI